MDSSPNQKLNALWTEIMAEDLDKRDNK